MGQSNASANSKPSSPSNTILVAVWNMISTGAFYDDPGPGYYARHNPERTERNAIRQLRSLGYEVTLKRTA